MTTVPFLSLSRRTLLALGLGVPLAKAACAATSINASAFSPIKRRLASGQNGVIFVNADSTGFSEHGPFYKMAARIGERCDATVVLHRWGEWVGSAPSGPKAYAAPVTVRRGSGPTLTVYLASLPGQVAGAMFDGSRRGAAIDAIPTPDLCILHHGHNMQSFHQVDPEDMSSGRGLFFGPLGLTELKWPGVAQVLTTQNPWQDSTSFDKVYASILDVARSHPGLTLVDSHAAFIDAGKAKSLFRDSIHPSDTARNSDGAELVASALLSSYDQAAAASFATPSWPRLRARNEIANGDFLDWSQDFPAGYRPLAGASAAKDSAGAFPGFDYALSLRPNGNTRAGLFRPMTEDERRRLAGKTISLAVLAKGSASQPRPFGSLVIPTGGAVKSIVIGDLLNCRDGWMWLVAAGIKVDAGAATDQNTGISLFPAFDLHAPTTNEPLLVQKIIVVEGSLPMGAL